MKVQVAQVRIFTFIEQQSMDRAEGLAWARKADAFGTLSKLFSRPKDEEFELLYKERRYIPFWHATAKSLITFDRSAQYPIPVKGAEIKSVTIEGNDYGIVDGKAIITGIEHCELADSVQVYVDALTGAKNAKLAEYLALQATEVSPEEIDQLVTDGAIVVPPVMAAPSIAREAVAGLPKKINADVVNEETLELETLDIYFRPVYAFQYRWLTKEREAVIEYDGLTGKLEMDGRVYPEAADQAVPADMFKGVNEETILGLLPEGRLAILEVKE